VVLYDYSTGSPVEIGRVRVPRSSHGMWTLTIYPFSGQSLGLGSHPLTAVYQGNATYQGSMSPAYTEFIRGSH
jgi:hypothetical protein